MSLNHRWLLITWLLLRLYFRSVNRLMLPGLSLVSRTLQNFGSKWLESAHSNTAAKSGLPSIANTLSKSRLMYRERVKCYCSVAGLFVSCFGICLDL